MLISVVEANWCLHYWNMWIMENKYSATLEQLQLNYVELEEKEKSSA